MSFLKRYSKQDSMIYSMRQKLPKRLCLDVHAKFARALEHVLALSEEILQSMYL